MDRTPTAPLNKRQLLILSLAIVLPCMAKLIAWICQVPFGIDMVGCTIALVFLIAMLIPQKNIDPFVEAEKILQQKEENKLKKNLID